LARQRGQVAAIFIQRLELVLRVGVGHALVSAQIGERPQDNLAFEVVGLENLFQRRPALVEQPQQQVLGAEIVVFELARLGLRRVQRLLEAGAEIHVQRTGALDFMAAGQFALQFRLELGQGDADLFQQIRDQAFRLADQGQQQVLAIHLLVRVLARDPLRVLQRLLRFDRKAVELHIR